MASFRPAADVFDLGGCGIIDNYICRLRSSMTERMVAITMAIFYVLLLFIIIAAIIAIETKNLLSSIICIGALGFGASLMFLFLRAPDIAITQIVVEVLGLIILIRATISRDLTFISGNKNIFGTVISVVIIFVIFLAGIRVFKTLPDFGTAIFTKTEGAASQTYIEQGLQDTGASNVVASVILDYRAYDTLGEATVLFTSIIGATVILRKKAKKLLEGPEL
jgi:multisubunit Na+/H+ antiporter MnhB subunit